jgi:hypothetical protein
MSMDDMQKWRLEALRMVGESFALLSNLFVREDELKDWTNRLSELLERCPQPKPLCQHCLRLGNRVPRIQEDRICGKV